MEEADECGTYAIGSLCVLVCAEPTLIVLVHTPVKTTTLPLSEALLGG